ncbi:MAG: PAS domain S-box protein [Desulfobacteraceae bacterium]|nr:PAS domain S-box protein [Desulfobacteraceae bacterium]
MDAILKDRVERLRNEKRRLRDELTASRKETRIFRKALRETRELLKLIPGAVVLIQRGKIIFTNEALREELGYSAEELLGQELGELIHRDSAEYVRALQQRRVSAKTLKEQNELYLVTKERERLCYYMRVKKIRYLGRKAFLLTMLCVDQEKREEMKLRRAQRMDSLVRMASGMNKELKGCLRALGDHAKHFSGRTPLENNEETRSVKGLETAWEMGSLISRQLSCLSKRENEPSDLSLLDVRKVLRDAISLTRPKLNRGSKGEDGNIRIKTYLRSLSPVKGNPQEIRDVLVAMILNAVDALPDKGEIYLTTEEHSGLAHVYIQDNGVGIGEDIRDKIFDPFFTTKGRPSSGLGLSLALAIVTRHGGDVEVISQEGKGSTFIVTLPIAQEIPRPRGTRMGIKNSHVLIISEGGIVQDLLFKSFLKKGARPMVVSTVREGLKLLKKNKLDLVIGNHNSRQLEPSKIIKKIKELDPDLPIVMVDSAKDRKSQDVLRKLGAGLVVGRPLEVDRIFSFFTATLAAKGRP